MKLPLLATRSGIMALRLLVALIVVLSVLPFLMGNIQLGFEADQGTDWTYQDGLMRLESPFTVKNSGFFDINDITVSLTLRDRDGDLLTESCSEGISAPAGRETNLLLQVELDLDDLPPQMLRDVIFDGTIMDLSVGFSARYSLDLVQASGEFMSDLEWEAVLHDMDVGTEGAGPMYDGEQYSMVIPYSFSARGMVEGQPVMVTVSFADTYGYQEEVVEVMEASDHVFGLAYVPIPQEIHDRLMGGGEELSASLSLTFLDCSNTVHESWWWSP